MPQTNPEEVFVFFHVPKTGGISIHHLLNENMELGIDFIHLGEIGWKEDQEQHRLPFFKRSAAERAKIRAIIGHDVTVRTENLIPGRVARRITFLRSPANRLISAYNYETSPAFPSKWNQPVSFDTWYSYQERDVMTKFLAKRVIEHRWMLAVAQAQRILQYPLKWGSSSHVFSLVQRALEKFWFVGCTERLDRDFPQIAKRMGIHGTLEKRNAAGRNFLPRLKKSADLEERLQRDNPWDTQLYNYWNSRIERQVDKICP